MAQDPWEEALARRKQKAVAPADPWEEALARRKTSAASPPADATATTSKPYVPTQRIRAAAQGAFLGLSDEAEAFLRSAGEETYEEAKKDIADKLAAYREDRPKEAIAMELAGGLTTGLVGGGRALAATAGRAGLREALKAGAKATARTALASNAGQGAISGYGAGEGGALSGERLKGAAIGGTVGAALPFLASAAAGKIARGISKTGAGQAASSAYEKAQRFVADQLPTTGRMAFLGRAIEPTDATRIQREAAANLPGGVAGPTVATMDGGVGAARTAKTQAEVAAEQGKLRSKQATTARSKAEQEAKEELERVRQEESTLGALTKQKAGAIKEQGKSRAERLSGIAKAAEEEAKAIKAGATAAIKETDAATREQAKAAAEGALEEARSEAAGVVGSIRGRQPRGTAKRLQESVRAKQLKEAEGHYEVVRSMGAPPDPDVSIYREVFDDQSLRSAYNGAVAAFPKEMRNAAPGVPALARPRMITINGEDVPEITLETMDQMRRRILNPPYDANKVGLSRSQRTQALQTIDRLEQRYLAGFGTDDAAEALRTARGAYREKFQILEAVQDGLNLGTVKAGKASGLLTQSRKELDEVAKRVENMTPKQRAAFQVGAREWFDRTLQEGSPDALAIAKKFSSEASQRRLALTYGDDAVEALRNFAPDVVGKRQGAAAARVREEGTQVGQQIASRAKADITPLQSRAERAAALAERAMSDKAARAEQVLGQRQADATRRVMETQRTTGATVRSAREEAGKAQDESSRLAEILSQARASATQAKQTPFGDLSRALGTSTQQQTFLQRLLPQMSQEQRSQSVEVLGSNIQRELQDMARAGKSSAEIMQRVKELQQNDVVRALLAPQSAAFGRQLTPTIGTRLPQALQASTAGLLGRQFGGGR